MLERDEAGKLLIIGEDLLSGQDWWLCKFAKNDIYQRIINEKVVGLCTDCKRGRA